ncbi:MAG TPA: cytidylate kinase family protein [Acidimicrobiales bacterium]|nr:cytidylate kinase family protein [Acidimicrobiales bacterium]
MLVTISGLPGSGTSTVADLVAQRLGLAHVDGGTVFRALAAEQNLDVRAFSSVAEENPDIDVELDARLAAIARDGDVVLESRLAAWIATNEGLAATTVWIDGDEQVRADRVARRERIGPGRALQANRTREASERLRYRTLYGIDLDDRSVYTLVIDATDRDPEDVAESIVATASK